MSIESINMAVPVGQGVADAVAEDSDLAIEVAQERIELNGLIQEFAQLLNERSKRAWSAGQLSRRREKFDVRTRGMIKKFAGNVAELVDDRHGRRRVRMRIYGDLSLALQTIVSERDARLARRSMINRRMWAAALLLLLPIAVVAIYNGGLGIAHIC